MVNKVVSRNLKLEGYTKYQGKSGGGGVNFREVQNYTPPTLTEKITLSRVGGGRSH